MATQEQKGSGEALSLALGCFSLGLGIAELAAPETMAKIIGISPWRSSNRMLLRAYGIREIGAGIGILLQRRQPAWLWARVAGDALDLASLGYALASGDSDNLKTSLATAAVAGVTALDVICAQKLSNAQPGGPRKFTRTVLINRTPSDVYQFWRNLSNLPRFMDNIESVEDIGNGQSRWRGRVTRGRSIEWEAEIVNDDADRLISWRTLPGALVSHAGNVQFAPGPGGRGTFVKVQIEYEMPGGAVTANLARLINAEPGQTVADELRRLKMVLETGEVVRSDASIHPDLTHAAQPPEQVPTAVAASA